MTANRSSQHRRQDSAEAVVVWRILSSIGRGLARLFGIKQKTQNPNILAPHWQRVLELWHEGQSNQNEHVLKSAIFEADKVLDEALRLHNVTGQTLGERLMSARRLFHSEAGYQSAWEAHKVRNHLAHELTELPAAEYTQALQNFSQAMVELNVIPRR